MVDIENLVRPNILELQPYSSARDEFIGREGIFLDANENPYGKLNRYPDPYQKELKQQLAELKGVNSNNIFVGNGSDEVIDLVFRIFCRPGFDKALAFSPTYGMYEVSAAINDVKLLQIPLDNEFQIDLETIEPYLVNKSVKVVFICSPNNPTGNLMRKNDIEFILKKFSGIVLVDEAYIDFAREESMISSIDQNSNLVVCQTFSKAWGLASARVGLAYANTEVISLLNKIKPPYNVSELNQKAALDALSDQAVYKNNLSKILQERELLEIALSNIGVVKKIYPSSANFILIEVENAKNTYDALVKQQIITRNRSTLVANSIRITVGTPEENKALLSALKYIGK